MTCKVSKTNKRKLKQLRKDARRAGAVIAGILLAMILVGCSMLIGSESEKEDAYTLARTVRQLPSERDLYTYSRDKEAAVLSNDFEILETAEVGITIFEPVPEIVPELVPVSHTDYERELMLYTVELEAHDASFYHKQIIACVIVNRMYSDDFPSQTTLEEVLTAKNQFSGLKNYHNHYYEPDEDTVSAVDAVLSGEIVAEDFSDGATFFYNPSRVGHRLSSFENRTFCFELEGHRFFK